MKRRALLAAVILATTLLPADLAVPATLGTGRVAASVVYLQLPSPVPGTGSGASGTGFVATSNATASYIVTSAHVLGCDTYGNSCHKQIEVRLPGAFEKPIEGELVYAGASNSTEDYAVVRVPAGSLPPVDFGTPSASEPVSALGFPYSQEKKLTSSALLRNGTITSVGSGGRQLSLKITTSHGDSGAPVFDASSGSVVGIVHGAPPGDANNEGFAIGVARIRSVITSAAQTATRGTSLDDARIRAALLFAYARDVATQGRYMSALSVYDDSHWMSLLALARELYSQAIDAGSLDAAIELVRPSERAGTLRAVQSDLVLHFLKNREAVFAMLNAASAAGDARATFALANYSRAAFDHPGTAQDAADALAKFKLAANQGSAQAMGLLAAFYYGGAINLTKNPAAAEDWRTRAADPLKSLIAQGDSGAAYIYAMDAEYAGPGMNAKTVDPAVVNDYVKAADLGSELALEKLGDKEGTWALNGSPDLQRAIFTVLKKALDAGMHGTYFGSLAIMYQYGTGTPIDTHQALTAYLASGADSGGAGIMMSGRGLVQNWAAIHQSVGETRGALAAALSTVEIVLPRFNSAVPGVVVGGRPGKALVATAAFNLGCDSFGDSCIAPASVTFLNGKISKSPRIVHAADASLQNGVAIIEVDGATVVDPNRYPDLKSAVPDFKAQRVDAVIAPIAEALPDTTVLGPESAVVDVHARSGSVDWGVLLGATADHRVLDLFVPFTADSIGCGLFDLRTGHLVGLYTDPWDITRASGFATIRKALSAAS